MLKKFCSKCATEKSMNDFFKDSTKKDGFCSNCKLCCSERSIKYRQKPEKRKQARIRSRLWHKNNKEYAKKRKQLCYDATKQRVNKLKKFYGLTQQNYDDLLKKQMSCCAICKTNKATKKGGNFPVDHCHKTGKIRGLLCHLCNRGLGMFKDDLTLLQKAVEYITQTSEDINVGFQSSGSSSKDSSASKC